LTTAAGALHRKGFDAKGGALNYEGSVISARERELLLLRAQTGDPEALNVLFESCREKFAYLHFVASRYIDA